MAVKKSSSFKTWADKTKCPMCNAKLVKKNEGFVCIKGCPLHFKCEIGWVYLDNSKKESNLFWTSKYDFDIARYENIKKWLMLKSNILYEKKCCEICKKDRYLHVHHILPRSSNPELTLDKEDLIVLCEDCHKKIHSEDKYKFGGNDGISE